MARQTFTIGTPKVGPAGMKWRKIGEPIDAVLVSGGGEAWIQYFFLGVSNASNHTLGATPARTGNIFSPGPHLTPAWERSPVAITIEAGSLSVTVAGPTHPDNTVEDETEPYEWRSADSAYATIKVFVGAFINLPRQEKAATTFTIDDGVATPKPPPPPTRVGKWTDVSVWTAILVQINANPIERYWTGDNDLIFGGDTYSSTGKLLGVGQLEQRVDVPNNRLQLVFALTDTSVRAKFLVDRGPLDTIVTFIKSTDSGATWSRTGWAVTGKLSTPLISDQTAIIEIETFKGDVDRGRVIVWSDEEQQRRNPGDRGFAYLRSTIHQNPKRNLRWPPGN